VCGCIVSVLIIASRKHYTVDIVIAWYTVPLVSWATCGLGLLQWMGLG
jgi:hypothetical protein